MDAWEAWEVEDEETRRGSNLRLRVGGERRVVDFFLAGTGVLIEDVGAL